MRRVYLSVILILLCCLNASAQFKVDRLGTGNTGAVSGPPGSETVSGENNENSPEVETDTLQGFSLKRLIRGYAGKDTLTPPYMLLGTAILPGAAQIYNHQSLKVPFIYAGMGAGIYGGVTFNNKYQSTGETRYKYYSIASYAGAGLVYWGHLLDGVVSYKTDVRAPVAAKSTLYSALLPGLGQAYNGDWWKIPIWYGGFIACGYAYHLNDMEYRRFKYICETDRHKETTGYTGAITSSQAEWYRDTYRRYRDYSILACVIVYALNVIDANVFAYMADFDVDDYIAKLELQPAVISPIQTDFACSTQMQPAFGLNLQLHF